MDVVVVLIVRVDHFNVVQNAAIDYVQISKEDLVLNKQVVNQKMENFYLRGVIASRDIVKQAFVEVEVSIDVVHDHML